MEAQEGKGMTDAEIDQALSGLKRRNSFADQGVFTAEKLYMAKKNPHSPHGTAKTVPQKNEDIINFVAEQMSTVI
jgi:hypothetical protein